jgi:hypothetical protein
VADDQFQVLARFDDSTPALIERQVGRGTLLVWSSSIDTFWNDLALQPVFLPFVHEVVKYLAGYTTARQWHGVGEVVDLSMDPLPQGALAVGEAVRDEHGSAPSITSAADSRISSAARGVPPRWVAQTPSGETKLFILGEGAALMQLEEQGFYELRPAGGDRQGPAADQEAVTLAVNLDYRESDLTPLDAEEFAVSVTHQEQESAGIAPESVALTPGEKERRQRFWWYLLTGVFLLLVAETLFSNRISRPPADQT